MSNNNAQVSLELMMVVALSILLISPLLYILFSYESDMTEEVAQSQITELYYRVMNDAYEVHYSGRYSKKSFTYRIPSIVEAISSPDNSSIVFTIGKGANERNISYYSKVPLVFKGFESKETMNNNFILIKEHGNNFTIVCSRGHCDD